MESTTDQIYTSQILKNENFEIVNQEYDENKQILKTKDTFSCMSRTNWEWKINSAIRLIRKERYIQSIRLVRISDQ